MFRFKQFNVDQTGCAMKINTDGVLLGVLADADEPENILDIGTGTGVIALMLAQRFGNTYIDAVEIDQSAAKTANSNFSNSPFAERMSLYPMGFEQFFVSNPDKKYDMIVSNPPFYINSLKSPQENKQLAKHADKGFFENLVNTASDHLNNSGLLCLILPIDTATLIEPLAAKARLYVQLVVKISSFENSEPHRQLLCFGFKQTLAINEEFIIYKKPKVYSKQYHEVLKDFFTIF